MPATFSRVKVWAGTEDLLTADLNAEFDNILNNLSPAGMDDYSTNVTQMRIQTSPGAQGSESLATSLSGELERLRFVVSRIIGETYWYDAPNVSLAEAESLISTGNAIPDNRIVSGRTRSATDGFPIFLQPHGTNATITLKGATTPFKFRVDGTEYTISADVTATGLSLAPSTNNTALVNDATLTGQTASKYAGEIDSDFPGITIDTVGTEISALVGKVAAFKVGTEHFLAFVESATRLSRAFRGFFFDSSDLPVTRVAVSDNDTITLQRAHWVFARTDGTIVATTSNPIYTADQPTSPVVGDYWFDLVNQTWKTYNGSSFISATAHLIGIALTDTSGCKGARSFEFFAGYTERNTIIPERVDANTLRSTHRKAEISVAGTLYEYDQAFVTWIMPGDLASGLTEQSSTAYYAYVTERGDTVLDEERPYERMQDLLGRYHPYHNWRAIGQIDNDGASNFDAVTLRVFGQVDGQLLEDRTVTKPKLATLGQQVSTSSGGAATTTSVTYVDVPNLAVTITTTGRPVSLAAISDGAAAGFQKQSAGTTGQIRFVRGATEISVYNISTTGATIDSAPLSHIDPISAGTYTYKVQFRSGNGVNACVLLQAVLVAYEL